MTQEEKDKKIAALEKELTELKKTPVNGRWKPENQDNYYYIDDLDIIRENNWHSDIGDKWRYLTHNVFQTREEAEEHQKEIETYFKFKNFVEERSEPIDWNNGKEKYFIYYDFHDQYVDFGFNYNSECQGAIYASSEQILRDAIDYIGGEEVAKRYLFGIKEQQCVNIVNKN